MWFFSGSVINVNILLFLIFNFFVVLEQLVFQEVEFWFGVQYWYVVILIIFGKVWERCVYFLLGVDIFFLSIRQGRICLCQNGFWKLIYVVIWVFGVFGVVVMIVGFLFVGFMLMKWLLLIDFGWYVQSICDFGERYGLVLGMVWWVNQQCFSL